MPQEIFPEASKVIPLESALLLPLTTKTLLILRLKATRFDAPVIGGSQNQRKVNLTYPFAHPFKIRRIIANRHHSEKSKYYSPAIIHVVLAISYFLRI